MLLLQILGTIGGLVGMFLVAVGRPIQGQVVWLPANLCWVIFMAATGAWGGVVLFSAYTLVCLWGIFRAWQKDKHWSEDV